MQSAVHQKFTAALDSLVDQIKHDRSILAAILCGSLSHDTVWHRSDIDLALVTADEKNQACTHLSLNADGINVHAFLMTRTEFRKSVEGAIRNTFLHSFFTKGRLLYTHDDSLIAIFETLQTIGERDTRITLLGAASSALSCLYKAHKWFLTRRDLELSALWILYTAHSLAKIEILSARQLADREVLPQAMKLNPAFFKTVYTDLLNARKTAKSVQAALDACDDYLAARTDELFTPILEHLEEAGETRSVTEIDDHFNRNYGIESVSIVCEYLADRGVVGKASVPARLTKRSSSSVEELAFFHIPSHAR